MLIKEYGRVNCFVINSVKDRWGKCNDYIKHFFRIDEANRLMRDEAAR